STVTYRGVGMKALVRILWVVVVVSLGTGMLWTQSNSSKTNMQEPSFSLEINADKPVIDLGSPVWIMITITNVSDQTIHFGFGRSGNEAIGFKYDVRNEEGQSLKRVEHHGDNRPRLPPGSTLSGILQPRKSLGESTMLSDIYELDQPGKYTVQVSRKEPGMAIIRSNTITITVVK
ncbi:MAG: hypothetical protein ACRD25_12935, partial [Terracidiphilus sp.]